MNSERLFIGAIFGKWKILEVKSQKSVCICECGTQKLVNNQNLLGGYSTACGCQRNKHMVDMVSQKFGKLTVIAKGKNNNKHLWWKCKCDCGKESEVRGDSLREGKIQSCGCMSYLGWGTNYKGYNDLSGSYFHSIRKGAKERNIYFDLNIEYLWELYERQNRKCVLSGVDIIFRRNWTEKGIQQTASLDRIDSSKGYIDGNVQWVHKDINYMKMNLPEEKFKEYCSLVHNNTFQPKIGSHRYMVYS